MIISDVIHYLMNYKLLTNVITIKIDNVQTISFKLAFKNNNKCVLQSGYFRIEFEYHRSLK